MRRNFYRQVGSWYACQVCHQPFGICYTVSYEGGTSDTKAFWKWNRISPTVSLLCVNTKCSGKMQQLVSIHIFYTPNQSVSHLEFCQTQAALTFKHIAYEKKLFGLQSSAYVFCCLFFQDHIIPLKPKLALTKHVSSMLLPRPIKSGQWNTHTRNMF